MKIYNVDSKFDPSWGILSKLSICLSLYSSINLSIHLSVYSSIGLSIYLSFCLLIFSSYISITRIVNIIWIKLHSFYFFRIV
jgi:hypothetical protein